MITIIHRPTKYIDKAIFVDKVLNDEQHLKLHKLTKPRGIGFFRALYIWIPIMLLFWTLLFFCAIASADEDYYYCIVRASLVKVSDINGDRIVPDIPFRLFSYYAVAEGACVTYSRDLKNEGKEIMACVAVKKDKEEALKNWEGYIGERFDEVKITADYAKHYPFTIADLKRTYDEKTHQIIEYEGVDKDNPARFCMWNK